MKSLSTPFKQLIEQFPMFAPSVDDYLTGTLLPSIWVTYMNVMIVITRKKLQEGDSHIHYHSEHTSGNLMLAIQPECNWNESTSHLSENGYILTDDDWYSGRMCKLGCDCDPLRVYVQSCVASQCTIDDKYPSELNGHYDASMTISSGGSTFFIQYDPFNPQNGYCDPNEYQEDCIYYIAITGSFNKEYTEKGTNFMITAATSDDVTLLPCDASDTSKSGDGVRTHMVDSITSIITSSSPSDDDTEEGKYYEVCNNQQDMNEYMIVNVEQCYGSSNLYACTEGQGQGQGQACQMGVLPTKNNWAYKTDGVQICTKTTHGDEKCNPIHDHPSTSHQSLTIPLSNGNVYIWIAGHNAEYEIQILETKYGGHQQAILIQGDSSYSMMNTLIHADVEYDTVTISWIPSLVVFPGMKRPVFTTNVKYYIIAVNMDHIHEDDDSHYRYDTVCGSKHLLASLGPSIVQIFHIPSPPSETSSLAYQLPGLKGGYRYRIMVYAECDHICLQQITETVGADMELDIQCSSDSQQGEDCHTITYMYTHTDIQTQQDTITGNEYDKDDNILIDDLITISFSIVMLVVVVLCMFGIQFSRRKQHADATRYEITEMVDLDMWTSTHATPTQVISQMKRQTALSSPLFNEDNNHNNDNRGDPMSTPSPLTRGLLNLSSPMHHSHSAAYSPMRTCDDVDADADEDHLHTPSSVTSV